VPPAYKNYQELLKKSLPTRHEMLEDFFMKDYAFPGPSVHFRGFTG